jgi:hypothetical protein
LIAKADKRRLEIAISLPSMHQNHSIRYRPS